MPPSFSSTCRQSSFFFPGQSGPWAHGSLARLPSGAPATKKSLPVWGNRPNKAKRGGGYLLKKQNNTEGKHRSRRGHGAVGGGGGHPLAELSGAVHVPAAGQPPTPGRGHERGALEGQGAGGGWRLLTKGQPRPLKVAPKSQLLLSFPTNPPRKRKKANWTYF